MTLTTTLYDLAIVSLSNLVSWLGLIVLGWVGVKKITGGLKDLGKEVPKWIDQYQNKQIEILAMKRAKLGLQQ